MFEKPPFGAKTPLSPKGGKNLNRRALFLPPLGEGGLEETERGPLIIHQIKILSTGSITREAFYNSGLIM